MPLLLTFAFSFITLLGINLIPSADFNKIKSSSFSFINDLLFIQVLLLYSIFHEDITSRFISNFYGIASFNSGCLFIFACCLSILQEDFYPFGLSRFWKKFQG